MAAGNHGSNRRDNTTAGEDYQQLVISTDEGEVQYVLIELDGELEDGMMVEGQSFKLTGLDSDSPELVLGNNSRWRGHYEELLGSAIFINPHAVSRGDEAVDPYVGHTELCLRLSQAPETAPRGSTDVRDGSSEMHGAAGQGAGSGGLQPQDPPPPAGGLALAGPPGHTQQQNVHGEGRRAASNGSQAHLGRAAAPSKAEAAQRQHLPGCGTQIDGNRHGGDNTASS